MKLSNGFKENIEYCRLDFLDPDQVARGDAFAAILPILWVTAGCQGPREDSKGSQQWFIPKHAPFAVLIKEKEPLGEDDLALRVARHVPTGALQDLLDRCAIAKRIGAPIAFSDTPSRSIDVIRPCVCSAHSASGLSFRQISMN